MLAKIAPYWKAVMAFITPGAVIIGSAVTQASDGGTTVTAAEIVTAVTACIVTSAAVWAAPRDPTPLPAPQPPVA